MAHIEETQKSPESSGHAFMAAVQNRVHRAVDSVAEIGRTIEAIRSGLDAAIR